MRETIILALVLLSFSCASVHMPADGTMDGAVGGIDGLLALCEKDLKNAGKVVIDNEIIKNLSHLQHMNAGGDKYYLLERENISKMILAVTEGIYTDFILINSRGTVIYTMTRDDIFGKNVRTTLAGSPLKDCFDGGKGVHFGGLSVRSEGGLKDHLLPSIPIPGGERSSGFFILQVDKSTFRKFLPKGMKILAADGSILVSLIKGEEGTVYTHFPSLGGKNGRLVTGEGTSVYYRPYRKANLDWILIRETR